MARSSGACQLARTLIRTAIDSPLPRSRRTTTQGTRAFTSSSSHRDDNSNRNNKLIANILADLKTSAPTDLATPPSPPKSTSMAALAKTMGPITAQNSIGRAIGRTNNSQRRVEVSSILQGDTDVGPFGASDGVGAEKDSDSPEPFHFHIYSHKHNTHVTVTRPNRNPIISLSSGNLGFRHAARGHYDSAYQLGAYTIDKLQQAGWHAKIHKMEVVLRGFGPGREAVTKVLLSNEGRLLRDKIVKVSDSTRLKFGGTRSRKPRRLG